MFPLRITTMGVAGHRVNLLYITAGETFHYILLKDLCRLTSGQNNNHNNKNISDNIFYMTKPVKSYWKEQLERSKLYRAQRIKLLETDNKKERLRSQAYKTEYQLCLPFVIYADFKSVLHKQDWCEPPSSKSFITQYQHHVPRGSCVYVKYSDGQYFEPPQLNIGDDAAERFLDQVLVASTICRQNLTKKISMKWLAQEQWRDYNNATNCSICTKPFRTTDKKVHNDHHLTIEYGCPAHNACNLNYHISHTFLFNVRNY